INEAFGAAGSGGATNLDQLTDVTITTAASGNMLRHNGSGQFVNVDPTAYLQPLDTDLTAIAALTSAANKVPYATGAGTWSLTDLTSFARTILDDTNAAGVQ